MESSQSMEVKITSKPSDNMSTDCFLMEFMSCSIFTGLIMGLLRQPGSKKCLIESILSHSGPLYPTTSRTSQMSSSMSLTSLIQTELLLQLLTPGNATEMEGLAPGSVTLLLACKISSMPSERLEPKMSSWLAACLTQTTSPNTDNISLKTPSANLWFQLIFTTSTTATLMLAGSPPSLLSLKKYPLLWVNSDRMIVMAGMSSSLPIGS